MSTLIQRLLSKKRNIVILVMLVIVVMGIATYLYVNVNKNLQKMANNKESVLYFPNYPATNAKDGNAEQIKRGEYLAKAGDCIACHTNTAAKEKAPVFAGGLAMDTPFGTIYTPNITPDKETGIGNWTDEQFIKAMRQGISPNGEYYYPAFPYLYFNQITTDDLLAIKAYLNSIPAVHQTNEKNTMVWPFNWRFLQLGWRIFFFNPYNTGPYKNDVRRTADMNKGSYLVNGLGHCSMCHTPSYYLFTKDIPLGAPIRKYDLTGMQIQGYLAPNICKTNLGSISSKDIVDVFTQDKMIGGGKIEGPMLEVNHDSLKYLTQGDLTAIAHYIKNVESQSPPKAKGGPGKAVYEGYCAGCHTMGAGGAPKFADAASWDPIIKKGMDTAYKNAINGIKGMPAKGTCLSCTNEEIKEAVDYMVGAATGVTTSNVVASIPRPKPLTMADGKHVYEESCSVCHAAGLKNAPKVGDLHTWKPIIDTGFLNIYKNVTTGKQGHPPQGDCPTCSDEELIAAIKYMLQQSSTSQNFELW